VTKTSKGGRPATGDLRWRLNRKATPPRMQWMVRCTMPNGKDRSPFIELPPHLTKVQKDEARAAAREVSAIIRGGGAVGAAVRETFGEYAARWLQDRQGRVKSLRSDRGRLTSHVLPMLGPLDVRTFGRADVERLRDDLDTKITLGELSWKTSANVWTVVTSMCADMMSAKKSALRVRDGNPCRDVKAPERGARKAKQYLYPSEFLAVVSCVRVPLRWRRAVALAVYTFVRDGELRALRWDGGDVDLDHGVLSITRAFNQNTKKLEQTKTGATRRFAVEPALLPLLRAMHTEAGGKGPVVALAPQGNMARKLRAYLKMAGVTRPELYDGTSTRAPVTWHDLRATGATWMAVRGDDPLKIKQRCGHTTFATTEIYIREALAVREGFGDVFPTLPGCLLDLPEVSDEVSDFGPGADVLEPKTRRFPCERRELNPHASYGART
jgi:integrase